MERYAFAIAFIAAATLAAPVFAQETEGDKAPEDPPEEESSGLVASPDRPTFSAGASTVPAGHAQLEAGVDVASADETSLAIPILARLGVADAFELRAGLPAVVIPFSDAPTELGSLQLGAKVAGDVTDTLSLGAMPFYDIPSSTGDDSVFSQTTYGAMGLIGLGFGDLGFFSNVGVSVGPSSSEESPRELFYSASAGAGYNIAAGFAAGLEGYGVFGQYADPLLGGDVYVAYSILDNLAVDAYFATTNQSDTTTFIGGAGVTYLR